MMTTVYTRILAERKTQNMNAEIVGSAYTHITIIMLLHLSKITILTVVLRSQLVCDAANMQVYTVAQKFFLIVLITIICNSVLEPAFYQSKRQYNYKQLANDVADQAHRAAGAHGSVKQGARPSRPPQPKSGAKDELLIDLSDDTKPLTQTGPPASKPAQVGTASLIDSSVAEKYEYLPPPLSEQQQVPADPFEIRLPLPSLSPSQNRRQPVSSSTVAQATYSANRKTTTASVTKSQVNYAQAAPMLQPSQVESTFVPSSLTGQTMATLTSSSSASQLSGGMMNSGFSAYSGAVQSSNKPSTVSASKAATGTFSRLNLHQSTTTGVTDTGGVRNTGFTDSLGRLQTYTNVPGESRAAAAAATPQANVTSPSSRYYSVPPVEPNYAPPPVKPGSRAQSVLIGELKEEPTGGHNKTTAHASPSAQPSQAKQPPKSLGKCKKDEDAFGWLNDTVADSLLKNSKNDNSNVNFRSPDKEALYEWETKNMASPTKRYGNSVFYDQVYDENEFEDDADFTQYQNSAYFGGDGSTIDGGGNAQNVTSMGAVRGQAQLSATQYHGVDTTAPPVPPKDYGDSVNLLTASSSLNQNTGGSSYYSNTPNTGVRIHPLVQDGEQKSYTHYWLLQDKQNERQMAEVKPFSVAKDQASTDMYQNLNVLMGDAIPGKAAINMADKHSKMAKTSKVSSQNLAPTGGSSNQMQQLTDLRVSLDTNMSMSEVKSKIHQVQKLVHGVTDEECQTALSSNHWNIVSAAKYLKLEQIFRLGVASRERCQSLLEAFNWDLAMACSVLLDEANIGSAV